jgi:transposase
MAKQVTRVRRTFTPQFKKDAVALIRDGRSLTEVAHDLGIARSLLQHWQKQLRQHGPAKEAFPGAGHRRPVEDEVHRLRQQLRTVTEERDILKKALAYFADDQK